MQKRKTNACRSQTRALRKPKGGKPLANGINISTIYRFHMVRSALEGEAQGIHGGRAKSGRYHHGKVHIPVGTMLPGYKVPPAVHGPGPRHHGWVPVCSSTPPVHLNNKWAVWGFRDRWELTQNQQPVPAGPLHGVQCMRGLGSAAGSVIAHANRNGGGSGGLSCFAGNAYSSLSR